MIDNSAVSQEAAERISSALVDTLAPLIEEVSQNEGKEGLVLLGTSLVSAGISLLQGIMGDGKTTEFLGQLKSKVMGQLH